MMLLFLALSTLSAAAALPPSSINLSVETTAADLAAMINRSMPKELYKGEGGMGTTVTVLRTGPIAVTAADNFVYLTLPVQLTFSYFAYESYPLRASLRFKAKVDVTPEWRLKTELYFTGLSDNLADTFELGPLSLKPKGMVENIAQPVQRLLAPIIDAKVNESVQLRAKVAPLWQNAFSPTLVSKEFSAWLKLAPEKIVMSPVDDCEQQGPPGHRRHNRRGGNRRAEAVRRSGEAAPAGAAPADLRQEFSCPARRRYLFCRSRGCAKPGAFGQDLR